MLVLGLLFGLQVALGQANLGAGKFKAAFLDQRLTLQQAPRQWRLRLSRY